MKRWSLLFLFLPFFAIAQNELKITGKITGLKNGSKVFIIDANKTTDTLAKSIVTNGAFVLTAKLKEPLLVSLNFSNGKNIMTFFDNSKVSVKGNIDTLDKLKVTGSVLYNDFQDFQKVFNPLFDKLVKTNQQMQFSGQTDSLIGAANIINDTIQQQIEVFIKNHTTSAVSAFLLTVTFQLKDDVMQADARMNQLKPAALNNLYGNYLKQTIAENKIKAVGNMATDFVQTDTAGNQVSLSSFRGKYVLLDFWASWCGPCRQENPNVVANYNKFKAKNFTVLGVTLDSKAQKEKWINAIHADQLTWTHLSDFNSAVAQLYRIDLIPQNLLIDPDGKIIAKNLRGPALNTKLCEVLGCN